MEDRTRLVTLLDYWMDHNTEHSQEFREWTAKVEAAGEVEAAAEILAAAQEMDKANEYLSRALKILDTGG